MKNVKGIVSLVLAVLFSLGVSLTAFAADALESVTKAATEVVGNATDAAVTTAKEKAGEAVANVMGGEKKEEEAADEEKKDGDDEDKEDAEADEKKEEGDK